MNRRLSLVIGSLMLLAMCVSCSDIKENKRKTAALATAEQFFKKFSAPGTKTQETWGITEFEVFGRIPLAAGEASAETVSDSPVAYNVTIPFWCRGKNREGGSTTLQRQLHLRLMPIGEEEWTVVDHQFTDDQPLTFARQAGAWLGWSFLAPIVLFVLLWSMTQSTGVARFIAGLLVLPLVGYGGYHAFGSWWAVPIGIIVYVVLWSALACVLAVAAAVKNS